MKTKGFKGYSMRNAMKRIRRCLACWFIDCQCKSR